MNELIGIAIFVWGLIGDEVLHVLALMLLYWVIKGLIRDAVVAALRVHQTEREGGR